MKKIAIVFFVTIGALLVGCKPLEKSAKKDFQTTAEMSDGKLSATKMVEIIEQNQPAFLRANMSKISIGIASKRVEMNVRATVKMVTDSAIHISVQPFMGIELFKLELTPSRMILIDKTTKTIFESNYGIFYEQLGIHIGFREIQALLTNRIFLPGERLVSPKDFEWEKNAFSNKKLVAKRDNFQLQMQVNESNKHISQLSFLTKDNYTFQTDYSNFSTFENILFPSNISLKLLLMGVEQGELNISVEDLEFEKPFEMKKSKTLRYKRGDIRQFVKALLNNQI